MKSISLIFQVHHPARFRQYRFFDIGAYHSYYDISANAAHFQKLAQQCYLPANTFLLRKIEQMKGHFRVAFYISGVTLRLMAEYSPEVLESFRKLAGTGCVEFLSGTFSYSLSSLMSKEAFLEEVVRHRQVILEMTGCTPGVFFNTGLIYSDEIGAMLAGMGHKGAVTEGAKHLLGWKSPDIVYGNSAFPQFKILLRNRKLSDDLAFRFFDPDWSEFPLTPEKFLGWLNTSLNGEEVVTLVLEYETFKGNHPPKPELLSFFDHFIFLAGQARGIRFASPSELMEQAQPVSLFSAPHPISWSGEECSPAEWTGNELQQEALSELYNLFPKVRNCSDPGLVWDWNALQISDHFSYMSTNEISAPRHHQPNPYNSPFDAFINYMNILNDFRLRLDSYS